MTFERINRRTHLYLGLGLMPWLLMYGVSSFIILHQPWFQAKKELAREVLFERAYTRPVTAQGVNNEPGLRAAAQEILKDCNLEGAFWVDKPNPDTSRTKNSRLSASQCAPRKSPFACTSAAVTSSPIGETNFGDCWWTWPVSASWSGWLQD